jgi:cytochrome c oxidase subunit II
VVIEPQAASWQLPPAMADSAAPADVSYNFIFYFSVVFTVVITVALLYFVFKYKRRPGVKSEPTGHFQKLEMIWTITPTIFIVFLFHSSYAAYIKNATAAEGATEVRARAKKWSWEFEYPGGARFPGELTLEVNRPYKMIISSEDVIHSFFIPEFRLKRDAVPGQYSFITFTPTQIGTAHVFCAEFCGTNHSNMLATVKVVSAEDYKTFSESGDKCQGTPEECEPAKWGEKLFLKNGCSACHGMGGSGELGGAKSAGPKLAGIFGKPQPLTAGEAIADENYLRESLLKPNAKIVAGYASVQMPAFVLKDPQIDAVIAYIKSLK